MVETGNYRVLVVEDNPVASRMLENALLSAGYEVLTAADGIAALETLRETFCPIVITDWLMPRMNGLELTRAIRESELPGYVNIMIMTALDGQEDVITGLSAGADDYITKPFNRAELYARLNNVKRILDLERSLRRAKNEIELLARTDPLTNVYNRRYLFEQLPREIQRCRRYQHPISLVMCDIDDFKEINDRHGHHAGDQVLREFASRISAWTRCDVDWLSRYGGEEFVLVLPEIGVEAAAAVGERLRHDMAKRPMNAGGTQLAVTASFGIAGFNRIPEPEPEPERFISAADSLMYEAKKQGKNRVVAARC